MDGRLLPKLHPHPSALAHERRIRCLKRGYGGEKQGCRTRSTHPGKHRDLPQVQVARCSGWCGRAGVQARASARRSQTTEQLLGSA